MELASRWTLLYVTALCLCYPAPTLLQSEAKLDWAKRYQRLAYWVQPMRRCGESKYSDVQKRIVGGIESKPHQWPWLVSFHLRKQQNSQLSSHRCGGTLITRQFILTSAHCFERRWHRALTADPTMWIVRLGEHNLMAPERAERQAEIEKIIIHRNRNPVLGLNFDVALVKLKCPVSLSNEINAACLPERNAVVPTGTMCVTAGWGTTAASSERNTTYQPHADKVRHVLVPVVDKMQCQNAYSSYKRLLEITRSTESICASNMDDYIRDACQYDSGGPLMCQRGVVHGIVSLGQGCAKKGFPGIYTNVAEHVDWINEVLTYEYMRCRKSWRRGSGQCLCHY